jgi:hypothetical protein
MIFVLAIIVDIDTLQLINKISRLSFPLYSMALRCCQSPQTCTAFAEIFLCFNSADQLKVEPTGQVTFTCPVPVGSIRQDTRSRYIAQRNGYSFPGQVKMKQAEIWFHMKKVPIYEDIIMYKASIF